ncbi:MAG: hypothetical protein ACKV2T_37450 [Kofleriaceae bacterium]
MRRVEIGGATSIGLWVLGACGSANLAACGSANPVPAGTQLGPALTAAMNAADRARTPWRCGASDGPVLTAETIGANATGAGGAPARGVWRLEGHVVSREGDGEIVIAAIADAGGAAPPTIAALGRLRERLSSADVVIALGGMGTTKAELEATLGEIANKVPIVVMPGDLEDAGELADAIVALRAKGTIVIDGRRVHRIEIGDVTVGLVSGAGAASRLVAGVEGCAYAPQDVVAIARDLSMRKGVRILASSEAPREVRGGEPTGELGVTVGNEVSGSPAPGAGSSAPADAGSSTGSGSMAADSVIEIDIALHGPMAEGATRARTGGRDSNAVALTPGTLDATPRLPDPARSPTAGLLVIRGDTWSWKPIADSP